MAIEGESLKTSGLVPEVAPRPLAAVEQGSDASVIDAVVFIFGLSKEDLQSAVSTETNEQVMHAKYAAVRILSTKYGQGFSTIADLLGFQKQDDVKALARRLMISVGTLVSRNPNFRSLLHLTHVFLSNPKELEKTKLRMESQRLLESERRRIENAAYRKKISSQRAKLKPVTEYKQKPAPVVAVEKKNPPKPPVKETEKPLNPFAALVFTGKSARDILLAAKISADSTTRWTDERLRERFLLLHEELARRGGEKSLKSMLGYLDLSQSVVERWGRGRTAADLMNNPDKNSAHTINKKSRKSGLLS